MNKNLVLTGMMGVGKSTIGKILAEKLSFNFKDIDNLIEEKEKNSISQIFKKKSEPYFRKIENEVTLRELKNSNNVISLGGGAFLDKSIRRAVKNSGVSFWLDVSGEELIKRLRNSKKRPLLMKKNFSENINKIYLERMKTYSESDYRIKCNFLKPEEIASRILNLYENSGN